MLFPEQSKLVRPRVFYTGLALAVALLLGDFLLLVRGQGSARQIEIYLVLFTLAILSVVYRYFSSIPKLKVLAARSVWFLVVILIVTAVAFVVQSPLNPPAQPPG